jgi:Phosphotransferase enzyme family
VNSSSDWPPVLQRHLEEHDGLPRLVEPLASGQSQAAVSRVHFASRSLILKYCERDAEYRFYTQIAPRLLAHGVGVPELCWSVTVGATCWLPLEDIPQPVPPARQLADPEMIAMLRRLHTLQLQPMPDLAQFVRPRWTDDLTQSIAAQLPHDLGQLLAHLQSRHQYLFQPTCPISGDPNPTNWGVRTDGKLALFDWDRFGAGTPAIDLAITIPNLGDTFAYHRVAACYFEAQAVEASSAVETRAHDIAIAKVWSVVHYLSEGTGRHTARVIQALPCWLEGIHAIEVSAGC